MMLNSTQTKTGGGRPGQSQNNQRFQSLGDIVAQFIDAMHAAGLRTDAAIVPDGELHRFRVEGDKSGSKNGYYTLHLDGVPSGAFGSWKAGINQTWCAINRNEMTPAQREDNRRRMEAAREASRVLVANKHRDAAAKAVRLWNEAKPAQADHPYLVRKGIKPGISRQKDDALVLPIHSFTGELKSLQFIGEEGLKRLLSGGAKAGNFILVQAPDKPARTMITEGWATAQTLAEIEPQARVLAAIDAGNLQAVAVGERKQWPDADIVVACDNDRATPGNPGLTKGRAAAIAAGAKMLIPQFPDDAPLELSDFNDLVQWRAKA